LFHDIFTPSQISDISQGIPAIGFMVANAVPFSVSWHIFHAADKLRCSKISKLAEKAIFGTELTARPGSLFP
jgi:hypothetical protein